MRSRDLRGEGDTSDVSGGQELRRGWLVQVAELLFCSARCGACRSESGGHGVELIPVLEGPGMFRCVPVLGETG